MSGNDSRMDEVVLLGAGASKDAGLPLSSELLELVYAEVRPRLTTPELLALHFAMAAVAWTLGSYGRNPLRADVEELVTMCDSLAQRRARLDAAFLPWPPLLESQPDEVPKLFRAVRRALEVAVATSIKTHTNAAGGDYLVPLLQSGVPTVATLNFDQLVEEVAARIGLRVSCGISMWHRDGHLDFGDATLQLLKLHGSVDWVHRPILDHRTGRRSGAAFCFPSRADLLPDDTPGTVLGAHGKLRADGPYLELFEVFRRVLWESRTLTVIGYSFRDEHINTVLLRRANCGRPWRMRIVTMDPPGVGELDAFERRGPQVSIVRARASEAVPQLFAGEAHSPRV